MDQKLTFWFYRAARHLAIPLERLAPWPRFAAFAGVVAIATFLAPLLFCLPQPLLQTSVDIFHPIRPAHLLALGVLGVSLAGVAMSFAVKHLRKALMALPKHVLADDVKDLVWKDAVVAGGRIGNLSLIPGVLFVGYGVFVSITTVSAPLHTRVGIALVLGALGAAIILSGFSFVFACLWKLGRIQGRVLESLHFDVLDPEMQGGITHLLVLVEKVILLWGLLSAMTWTVGFFLVIREPQAYPIHERIVTAIVLFLEFLAAFLMYLVWKRGALWIETEKKALRARAAPMLRNALAHRTPLPSNEVLLWILAGECGARSAAMRLTLPFISALQAAALVEWVLRIAQASPAGTGG